MRDFLMEIGVEEVPVSHLQNIAEYIENSFNKTITDAGLPCGEVSVSYTPRRFYLIAKSLEETQADVQITRTGPAKKIALDDEGNLLPAGLGFLKKNSATKEDIFIENNEKGEFIAVSFVQKGKPTHEILTSWVKVLLPGIPTPKSMLWNETQMRFSRPLRWLCLLWGTDILKLEVAGVESGNFSFGNRYLGLDIPLTVPSPEMYLEILMQNRVIANRSQRRSMISSQLDSLLAGTLFKVVPDERLIDTVTDLVEQPVAVVSEFSQDYLVLPEKIITSTISQNQKYFSVQDASGKLTNKFVFISNGDPEHSGLIRKGNEKVVAARLADALWYFQEDTKKPLDSYLPKLEDVVFQSKLGTIADKCKRVSGITGYLCDKLNLDAADKHNCLRTALLCKADLVTNMLGEKEFTKLQGYIGMHYALVGGEAPEVASGIYEHYMPRGTNDSLPKTLSGAIVAIADKVDSVCGIIGVGLLPTGSADPFALRRSANGIVQIICERGWQFDLNALLNFAQEVLSDKVKLVDSSGQDISGFFRQRVEWQLKQMGMDYDVIDSVMHLSLSNITDLVKRALALQSFRKHEDFIRLVIGFKRVANILGQKDSYSELQERLLIEPEEKTLFAELIRLRAAIEANLSKADHKANIAELVKYGLTIDSFFAKVLVNCGDVELREHRHSLLNAIKKEFLKVADISRIVLESE